jgi:hypothetical protein
MPPPETNDPLDALLRENDAYIEDAGFTARVITTLPRRRRSGLRPAILFSATVVGFALILWWLPPVWNLIGVDRQGAVFVEFTKQSFIFVTVLGLAAASLLWTLYATLKWEE